MLSRLQSLTVLGTLVTWLFTAVLAEVSSDENRTLIALPPALTDEDFLYNGAPDPALVRLGRNLFFAPILSGNRNISCGTCPDPASHSASEKADRVQDRNA